MRAYIRSASCVSPQQTFDNNLFLNHIVEYTGNRLTCIEPDYHEIIDPRQIRRMSRIIKMSIASAFACLKYAGVVNPDAIVTGTAYGCLEDTGSFLTSMMEYAEEPVAPTAFVQSTHNTIGAQVALLLKCTYYNNTFVSGGASFENALQDGMMVALENNEANILVGGMDEITDMSQVVLTRLGLYKPPPISNLNLFRDSSKGTIGGEGVAFFLLSGSHSDSDLARIDAVSTFYKPENITETERYIQSFLATQAIDLNEIDLLILGSNGDEKNDKIYTDLQRTVFSKILSVNYKNLCGEYPTSTAFALWLGVKIIETNTMPSILERTGIPKEYVKKVLIYNHYQNIYHSLILVSAC